VERKVLLSTTNCRAGKSFKLKGRGPFGSTLGSILGSAAEAYTAGPP